MKAAKRGWLVVVLSICLPLFAGAVAAAADEPGAAEAQETVTLDLKDVDIRVAIEALFRNTGRNFAIDQNVSGTIPVLSFKDVPFETALRQLTRSAGLVFRVDGDIYIISRKPESTEIPYTTPEPLPVVQQEPTTSELRVEKITLNYSSPSEILAIMSGGSRGFGGGLGYGYGQLLGYGAYGSYGGGYMGGGYSSGYGRGSYGSSYGYPGYGGGSYGGGVRFGGYGGGYGSGYGSGYGTYGGFGSYGSYGGAYRGW